VWVRWVPIVLKDQEKINRIGLPLQYLWHYADEKEDMSMLNRIVTRDDG
jgi:hypothetical protein